MQIVNRAILRTGLFISVLLLCIQAPSTQEIINFSSLLPALAYEKPVFLVGEEHDYAQNYVLLEYFVKAAIKKYNRLELLVERSFAFAIFANEYVRTGDKKVFAVLESNRQHGFRDRNEASLYTILHELASASSCDIVIRSIEIFDFASSFSMLGALSPNEHSFLGEKENSDIQAALNVLSHNRNDDVFLVYEAYLTLENMIRLYPEAFSKNFGVYASLCRVFIKQATSIFETYNAARAELRQNISRALDILDEFSLRDRVLYDHLRTVPCEGCRMVWYGSAHISRQLGLLTKDEHPTAFLYDYMVDDSQLRKQCLVISLVYKNSYCYYHNHHGGTTTFVHSSPSHITPPACDINKQCYMACYDLTRSAYLFSKDASEGVRLKKYSDLIVLVVGSGKIVLYE